VPQLVRSVTCGASNLRIACPISIHRLASGAGADRAASQHHIARHREGRATSSPERGRPPSAPPHAFGSYRREGTPITYDGVRVVELLAPSVAGPCCGSRWRDRLARVIALGSAQGCRRTPRASTPCGARGPRRRPARSELLIACDALIFVHGAAPRRRRSRPRQDGCDCSLRQDWNNTTKRILE
jgi:hypothetical protein